MPAQFRTEVMPERASFRIDHHTPTLLVGSCFAQNMGCKLSEGKIPALTNPLGTMYNPHSVAMCLEALLAPRPVEESELMYAHGLWHSPMCHSALSRPQADSCLSAINQAIARGAEFVQRVQRLVVTFGTARLYRLASSGKVVANCHKLPASSFAHELMSVESIVALWDGVLRRLRAMNPDLRVVFTVSPIRHWKDGPTGNQRSKATLLLAVGQLVDRWADMAHYFPAYELLLDDLRDYRFYADDLLHPSPMAVEYIWEKFAHATMDEPTIALLAQVERIGRAAQHRPFNPHSEEHRRFVQQTLAGIERLRAQHPELQFEEEERLLRSPLG
ncbi:MAG: GSCFA domain-containing protein [Bacteroidales bacterium]|nr:GSCFA domain-containing protein [Bacteroidales bacterium]